MGDPRRLNVGILDLVYSDAPDWSYLWNPLRPQFAGIMPQAVAVWARHRGHRVSYGVYYGQCPPEDLLPKDLDLVFLSHFTRASALAYALAKILRQRGTRVIGAGPHARAFPEDGLRFFDAVIQRTDRRLIEEVLAGHWEPGTVLDTDRPMLDLPTVAERAEDIEAAHFGRRFQAFGVIPLLASTGCPYQCGFCVDAKSRYLPFESERLLEEVRFIGQRWPGRLMVFHDPNFGVRFEAVMGVLESIPSTARNPYVIQASLSVLRPERLPRLRDTGCVYLVPGIESWSDCGAKAGTGTLTGRAKLEAVIEHLRLIGQYVPNLQANFVLGTDVDEGAEPWELTAELAKRLPNVYPAVFLPAPFGGTALFEELHAEGRLLESLPFACYYDPYLAFVPRHYSPEDLYAHRIRLLEAIADPRLWWRRLGTPAHPLAKLTHSAQLLAVRAELPLDRHIQRLLQTDLSFRAFHEGATDRLPDFYRAEVQRRLGRYAALLTEKDLRPRFPALAQRAATSGVLPTRSPERERLTSVVERANAQARALAGGCEGRRVALSLASDCPAANDGERRDPRRRVA